MYKPGEIESLRTATAVCKTAHRQRFWPWWATVLTASLLPACSQRAAPKTITLTALEGAPPVAVVGLTRVTIRDPEPLRGLVSPLGPRLGLLRVRSAAQWSRLTSAAPELGRCPDFGRGIVVGLVCWAGSPVDGQWPIHIDAIRLREGAGLIEARFQGGSYLPDGATYLETAHVPGLTDVLVVDINGTTFCPD
jgi:hypothetical protein